MKLILSVNVAKKLQKNVSSISEFVPDLDPWRVDIFSLRKKSIFIITNEKTLYTYISAYKAGIKGIIKKIHSEQIKSDINLEDIEYIKHQNKSITGSMTNMKSIIAQVDKYMPVDNERLEKLINNTIFKYLSYSTPTEVHSSHQ